MENGEYYTIPPLHELRRKAHENNGRCIVENDFTVGRVGFGNICWTGPTDLTDVCVGEIVKFEHKEVTVYHDDMTTPAKGVGLNKPARVTLERVYPKDKVTQELITDTATLIDMNYEMRVKHATMAMGASFVDYQPSTGTWMFDVEHFSKYGMKDEDEEENVAKMPRLAQRQPHTPHNTSMLDDEHNLSADTVRLMSSIEKASRLIAHTPQQAAEVSYLQQDIKPSILYNEASLDYPSKMTVDQSRQLQQTHSLLHELHLRSERLMMFEPNIPESDTSEMKADVSKIIETRAPYVATTYPPVLGVDVQRSLLNRDDKNETATRRFAARFNLRDRVLYRAHEAASAKSHIPTIKSLTAKANLKMQSMHTIDGVFITNVDEKRIDLNYVNALTDAIAGVSQCTTSTDANVASRRYVSTMCDNQSLRNYTRILNTAADVATRYENFDNASTFRLLHALYADLGYPADNANAQSNRRVDALLQWIAATSERTLERRMSEVANIDDDRRRHAAAIHAMISCAQQQQAAAYALTKAHMPQLACALATTPSLDTVALIRDQIKTWRMTDADRYLAHELHALHALLAGVTSATKMSVNGKVEEYAPCMELDWVCALGVHARYVVPACESIDDLVRAYEKSAAKQQAPNACSDTNYLLVRAYVDRQHVAAIDAALDSGGSYLGWYVNQLLRAAGVATLDDSQCDALTVRYALHLHNAAVKNRSMRTLRNALYVAMHVIDNRTRTTTIRECLLDYTHSVMKEKSEELIAQLADMLKALHLPEAYAYEAVSLHARNVGDADLECKQAYEAEHYSEAHAIFVRRLAPQLLFSVEDDNVRRLSEWCARFERVSSRIAHYPVGVDVYRLHLIAADITANNEVRREALQMLLSRVTGMQQATRMQRVACVELSRRISLLCRELFTAEEYTSKLGAQLARLHSNTDYCVDEMRERARRFLESTTL